MIKKAKKAAKKSAKSSATANTKNAGKGKSKSSVKKAVKKAVSKVKSKVVKKAKALASPKKKSAIKSKTKSRVKGKIKSAGKKKVQSPVVKNENNQSTTAVEGQVEQPVMPEIISHGADQHFIPIRSKDAPPMVHDNKKEEKLFHNREEVALHQENQKIKANMASRMARKRIFRIQGR